MVKGFFCSQDFFFFNCAVKDCNRTPFYTSAIFLASQRLNNVSSHEPPSIPSQQHHIQNDLLAYSSVKVAAASNE